MTDEKLDRIYIICGPLYREIEDFFTKFNQDENNYIFATSNMYSLRCQRLTEELGEKQVQKFLIELERFFELSTLSTIQVLLTFILDFTGLPTTVPGDVYDKGILYRDRKGILHPVNLIARKELCSIYVNECKIPSILSTPSTEEQRILLERQMIQKEIALETVCIPFSSTKKDLQVTLPYKVQDTNHLHYKT